MLDEFHVLIENGYRESGIQIEWQVAEPLPLVWADRYGLVQVLLNLIVEAYTTRRDRSGTGLPVITQYRQQATPA